MRTRSSPAVSPPEKGSFPIDHFRECDHEAEAYRKCLMATSGIPKKCKDAAQAYLECRMDKGLMARHSPEELGFIPESSWEFEKKSIHEMYARVDQIMKESRQRVWEEHQRRKKAE